MTAKQARIISKCLIVTFFICCISGIILSIGAIGTSDFYTTEIRETIPSDIDLKIAIIAFVLLAIAYFCVYITKRIDFSIMYDLNRVPLFCTNAVRHNMKENIVFKNQVNHALDRFYNGNWGKTGIIDQEYNDSAFARGKGRIVGEYHTIFGNIFIITEADRSITTILFVREY